MNITGIKKTELRKRISKKTSKQALTQTKTIEIKKTSKHKKDSNRN
jgi:hypothetical protein